MNFINKAISYQKNQNQLIHNNKNEIERSNMKLGSTMLIMGWLAFIPFLIISFLFEPYHNLTVSYLIEFVVLGIFLLFHKKIARQISSVYLIYIIYATLIGYATYTSAFVTPEFTSVIILFFLFQIPIITIDKDWRVNSVVILYALLYMMIAIPFKDGRLVSDEILNCLLFTAFGIGLGQALRAARLENFELKRQALICEKTDYLTSLNNRKSLYEYLNQIEASKKLDIGILMIDIDYFKSYNDTYGHQAGDDCLKRISDCFRRFEGDYRINFFRYGGEEFIGVAVGHNPSSLLQICEMLNHTIYNLKIPHISNKLSFVTISIGLACAAVISSEKDEKNLMSQADIALYMAKMKGRNRSVPFIEGMTMELS